MGLVNRLTAPGETLGNAVALATQISKFPQLCMRNDRRSAIEQWSLDHDAALLNETRLGLDVIRSGETLEGAARFASGAGRHGSFEDFE